MKRRQAEEKAQSEQKAKEEAAKKISEPVAPTSGKSDNEREARKIQKKLNAIEGLKKRLAAGETLEKDQLEKIKGEESLREQLEKIQI